MKNKKKDALLKFSIHSRQNCRIKIIGFHQKNNKGKEKVSLTPFVRRHLFLP